MTNTKVNKCKANDCSHSKKFIDRYDVIDNKVIRKDNHKWHFCQTCDKVVHKDFINYHEMRCKIFHDLQIMSDYLDYLDEIYEELVEEFGHEIESNCIHE